MRLSGEDIAALAAALADSPYGTLRLAAAGYTILLRREGSGWSAESVLQGEAPPAAADVAADAAPDAGPAIRAPLVGTFYRAPRPGAPPFVDVGSTVTPETVIGIIETMKLMNSVYAGASGRVTDILAADATFVEAGQTLMRIDVAAS